VDPGSQFAGYYYQVSLNHASSPSAEVRAGGVLWRPNLSVKAFLPARDSKTRDAVSVAKTALLYHQGRALVYVQLEPGKFERREVQVLGEQDNRWVLASGVKDKELVVSRQAELLLSEEFRVDVDND